MTNLDYIVEGCPACDSRDPFLCSEQVHEGTKPCRCDCHGMERPECSMCGEDAAHVVKVHGIIHKTAIVFCQKHFDEWQAVMS